MLSCHITAQGVRHADPGRLPDGDVEGYAVSTTLALMVCQGFEALHVVRNIQVDPAEMAKLRRELLGFLSKLVSCWCEAETRRSELVCLHSLRARFGCANTNVCYVLVGWLLLPVLHGCIWQKERGVRLMQGGISKYWCPVLLHSVNAVSSHCDEGQASDCPDDTPCGRCGGGSAAAIAAAAGWPVDGGRASWPPAQLRVASAAEWTWETCRWDVQ